MAANGTKGKIVKDKVWRGVVVFQTVFSWDAAPAGVDDSERKLVLCFTIIHAPLNVTPMTLARHMISSCLGMCSISVMTVWYL